MPSRPPVAPPLPRRLADPRPVIAVGTLVWVVALVVVLVRAASGHANSMAIATCAVGAALGLLGYGIFYWQRRAVRSGSRGSQQGLS